MAKMSKLKDLKMPKKSLVEDEVDLDLASEELEEGLEDEEMSEEDAELMEDEVAEQPTVISELEEVSDEDLLAEAVARGLVPEEETAEEDIDEDFEDEDAELV